MAFTRQGRCQEREEVLGTTKPPYTLALIGGAAARGRLRRAGSIDATAERLSIDEVIARLDARRLPPDAHRLSQHDADARRRRRGDGAR